MPNTPHIRGKIEGLSAQSARRLLFTARNVSGLVTMITLTYPGSYPLDGRQVKNHWKRIKQCLIRRGLSGLWWLEFQKRGAPHIHLYVTGRIDKDELSTLWYAIVGSGDERHKRAGTTIAAIRKPHAVAAYAAKYAGKRDQKVVPPDYQGVGRLWGLFGGLKVEPENEASMTLEEAAPVLRVIKKLDNSHRQEVGQRARADRGRASFTCYGNSRRIRAAYSDWKPPAYIPRLKERAVDRWIKHAEEGLDDTPKS